jgi:hypothetical protein
VTRNSDLDGWSNGVWNQVFCGAPGAPAQNFNNGGVYTTLATCPVTEEEPFLYSDSQGNYNVFVPVVQHNSSGPAWTSGTEAGTSIPLSKSGGTDIFFQNEMPYDPPSQSAWMASPTQDGYPSFLVTGNVRSFQGYGMGSYIVFIQTTATLFADAAFQAPKAPGVQFHGLLVVYLGGTGGDKSIINGVGGPVTSTNNPGIGTPVNLTTYP